MNKAENNNDFSTAVSEIGFNGELFKIISEAVRLGGKKVRHALIDNIHLEIREKTDKTLVTQVDEEGEKVITKRIKRSSTGTIRGEEFGETVGDKKYIWYIDPIDGTSSFSRGQQYSTVGVCVYKEGLPLMSAICHPYEKKMVVAEVGKGTWLFELNEKLAIDIEKTPTKLEIPNTPSTPIFYIDALFNGKTSPRKLGLLANMTKEGRIDIRATGSNIDQQFQVAMGRGDITLSDAKGGFHDLAVGNLIIKECGGIFVDVQTWGPISEKTEVAIGGNKDILQKFKEMIQDAYKGYNGFK